MPTHNNTTSASTHSAGAAGAYGNTNESSAAATQAGEHRPHGDQAATQRPPAVHVKDVHVSYGTRTVLDGATLELHHGQITALIGPNGAGKSTLFKTIMGHIHPTRGTVTINTDEQITRGADAKGAPSPGATQTISYIPQHDQVNWNFPVSVRDVVTSGVFAGARNRWIGRLTREQKDRVNHALQAVNMTDLAKRHISELSGGQKKRTFVARGLAQGSSVLLLDEPFAGVDQDTENSLIALFHQLRDEGCALLIATHNLDHVPYLADSVAMLNRTIVACGPVASTMTKDNLVRTFTPWTA